jgi:hypothetical protein
MVKKQKIDLKNIGLLILAGFAWSKLGFGAAVKDVGILTPPAPSCPVGEIPRWFIGKQIINGREVGPGWVCLPVEITRL